MESEGYTASQLARIAGVSVRTLHHYDQVGLLVPARRANGYRAYSPADVARLQQILLYRELGMDLSEIGRVLDDPGYDELASLRTHLQALSERRSRLDRLIATVRRTIDTLEGDSTMTDQERFEGLKRAAIEQNEREYGAEARARHGSDAVDKANERLQAMGQEEWGTLDDLEGEIKRLLAEAMGDGDVCGSLAARLVSLHAQWVSAHWPEGSFSPEAHRALADSYLCDQRFVDYYDGACGAGATRFLRDAIHAATNPEQE